MPLMEAVGEAGWKMQWMLLHREGQLRMSTIAMISMGCGHLLTQSSP